MDHSVVEELETDPGLRLPETVLEEEKQHENVLHPAESSIQPSVVLKNVPQSKVPVSESELQSQTSFPEQDSAQVEQSLQISPRSEKLSVYNFELGTTSTVVKRSRGRPRKDIQRTSRHHGKVFPGRPRLKGKKFGSFFMAHTSVPTYPQNRHSDIDGFDDFQCDVTSNCSPTKMPISSLTPDNELKIEKFCVFCNLSENSLLGQGKFKFFKPTPGFEPEESFKKLIASKERDDIKSGGDLKILFKKNKHFKADSEHPKHQKARSLQSFSENTNIFKNPMDELEYTGFKVLPEFEAVFHQSGEISAHLKCAVWSIGVVKTIEKKLTNVDKAVIYGLSQKCHRCDRYGATVKCCETDCNKIFHYPCAVMYGVLQNIYSSKMVCSSHLEDLTSFGISCSLCNNNGDITQLLLCAICSNYYHGPCLDPPINSTPEVRAGWQCFNCKVCQCCSRSSDGSKMLVCTTCDKGYHNFCLKPAIVSIPKSGWKCPNCRLCGDCGARTPGNGPSSRWHLNYTVCDSCYQQRNKGIACPLCGKAYRQFSKRKEMKHCSVCQKYIHADCDKRIGISSNFGYVCPICASSTEERVPEITILSEYPPKDNFHTSSRDSFISGNEESISSVESEYFFNPGKFSKRRSSSAAFRQKKSQKPKFKSFPMPGFAYPTSSTDSKDYKQDDDPSEDNKMILASANDEYVLCQDLCVMCGSFGKGEEGRLIACAQCGQCYHSYCASIKVTTVVLKKGWRCLDCTVCEGCGQPHDESRLLLCDECDISFHIYCLDPPLQEVPQGNWKCKWCVVCIKCGSKSPGYKCNWQVNYTHCGPCASILICCWCQLRYEENDLIVQCSKCDRWLHGLCDHISTEEDAEKCADCDYMCPHCRPPDELPPHLLPPSRSSTPETEPVPEKHTSPITKVKEQDPPTVKSKHQVQFYLDGVCLSESGIQYIKALMPEQPKKVPRPRKLKQNLLGASSITDPPKPVSVSQVEKLEDSILNNPEVAESKFDVKSEEGIEKNYDAEEKNGSVDMSKELPIEANAEKKKRPRKLQKMGIGGFVVKPRGRSLSKDPMEADTSAEVLTGETPSMMAECSDAVNLDKPKRKRKPKKKTALDESFPNYLRDAFFGKDLLTSCKKLSKNIEIYDPNTEGSTASKQTITDDLSKAQSSTEDSSLATTPDGKHLKITDNIFVQDVKGFLSSGNVLGSKQTNVSKLVTGKKSRSDIEGLKEERISVGLSSSNTSGLPQMDCKDVEDVFQGVLRDHRMSQSVQFHASGSPIMPKSSGSYVLPQSSVQSASQPSHPEFLQHFQHQDSNHSWTDSECDQTQIQKNMMKWESDENLGLLSTISPVLYANINLPHLKIEFPNWSDRVKQIAKIWRSLPAEKRQPYLQRARENRTASRSQKCNTDRDPERSIKDAKIPEVDAEKQWKQFQALRQMQLQNQQRILQEKRVQVAMKARIEKPENSPEFDLSKEIKLFQSKSLSDVPQLSISDSSHLSTFTSKDIRNKIYEKRWSTGTSPDLGSGNMIQGNKAKVQTPPPLQQSLVHERIPQSSLIQVSRVRTPVESPHQSIPDAPVPQVPAAKPLDVYHKSTISSLTQHGSPRDAIPSRQAILANQIELSRVPSPMLQKETLYTPPSTPRPQSSESFFQIASSSPQSHLLSAMDSHSQPTPMSSKMVSTPPSVSRLQDIDASALAKLSPKIAPSSPGIVSQISTINHEALGRQSIAASVGNASPNAQLPKQPIDSSDFSIQSGLNFPSANLSKELSHYKSAYPAISKVTERDQLLVQNKTLEHRNLDQFLQGNRVPADDPSKLNPNQQLRDLLQNKKPEDPSLSLRNQDVSTVNEFKHEKNTEQIIPRIESQGMNVSACNSPSSRLDNNLSNSSKSFSNDVNSQPVSSSILISPSSTGILHEKEKPLIPSDVTAAVKPSGVPLSQPSAKDSLESAGKRKTTAADLVKDLESQHEHDVIASGCNLDALTGDVGELELDDDELLGLGNDFNILEYADPELDKGMVGEGEKSNILDEHLDLDDKDEELEAEVIKEQENPQEKDLIPNPRLSHEKKEPLSENQKCDSVDKPTSQSDLQENFLNFKKDSFGDAYKQDTDKCSVDELTCTIKEEPKTSFSSCNLTSEISDIDIKPEKNLEDACSMQKKHHLAFSQETQSIALQRTELHCPDQILPPPYRMVTTLKQNINPQSPQHQPNPLSSQNKNLFPLHMNINVRHDLQLPQQGVMPLPVQTNKPLLLQEQPLILEDLVEEEKREQRRQAQEGLISPDALLSDIDFERLKDDVFSGPPDDSIGGPGSLLGSHEPPLQVSGSHSVCVSSSSLPHGFGPPPYPLLWQGQDSKVSLPSRPLTIMQNLKTKTPVIGGLGSLPGSPIPQKAQAVAGNVPNRPFCQTLVSTPPSPPVETLDPEKLKLINHEKYLLQQQAVLSSQQKFFETDVIKLRKMKKALNAKQRQMRKNGSELSENDALELNRVSQEQAVLQKQLDQVRKQTRQNSIALQDYRLKQQKRQQQQQPPQQVPRSPLHTSVSSVQSSPQNSQSPLQFQSQIAPQSPMMPSSPVGQSPTVRIQHPQSPLLHHSPVSLAPSSVHQTSPHVHQQQQLFPQQMHMQAAKPEAKGWGSAVKGTQVGGENLQISERFQKRELQDRSLSTSPFPFPSTSVQSPLSESGKDSKKSSEAALKRFPEETASPSSNAEAADKQIIPSCVSGSEISPVSEQKMETDPENESVSPNILTQSLPSSVTNTLKFTLRQTGMPTVCLQTGDSNSVDGSSQITYNLSPAEIPTKSEQKMLHDPVESKVDVPEILCSPSDISRTELGNTGVKLIKEEDLSNEMKVKSPHSEILDTNSSQSHKIISGEMKCKQEHTVSTDASLSDVKFDKISTYESQGTETKNFARNTPTSVTDQNSKEGLLSHIVKQEIIEDTPASSYSEVLPVIKTELGSSDVEHSKSSVQLKKDSLNDASSDEELENLRKTTNEQEHEQNVLLKQLLQNCPSAETSRKADNLAELKKDDVKDLVPLEVPFELNESQSNKKPTDAKTKKQTYLDIRRAQLDKEPTPPPGESKIKPIKRKRPKKKKLEDKMDSLPKKKCRRSSSKQEEGYENYVENLMTKLTNLPPLRILEPNIKPNFNAIPIFGDGDLNANETQLRGCYGSATLPNENDIYSCLPYSREEPPSTASLPPSSPPYRGFYNQEFPPLAKALERNEMSDVLRPYAESESRKIFRDAGSPDTIISSSSPETCLFEPLSIWPELVFVDQLNPPSENKSYSPVIPLVYPIPIRIVPRCRSDSTLSLDLDDKDKENIPHPDDKSQMTLTKTKMTGIGGYSAPLKDSGNVAVTLTLSSAAAEDICGVLSALADLLKIPIPATYDIVERTATPPSQKLGLYRQSKNSSEVNIHTLLNGKPRFCRHCDIVVLSAGIRKKAVDLTCISREEQDEDEVIFCSTNCYMQFALTHQSSTMLVEKEAATVVGHTREANCLNEKHSTNSNTEDALNKAGNKETLTAEEDSKSDIADSIKSEFSTLEDKSFPSAPVSGESTSNQELNSELDKTDSTLCGKSFEKLEMAKDMETANRKWRSIKYKYWSPACDGGFKTKLKEETVEKPTRSFYHTIKPSQMPKDERRCTFCHVTGDGDTHGSARLLNVDVNKWVHLNCALWSAEVYETVNGALMNVETAYKRSMHLSCCHCHKQGASVRCFKTRCPNVYHFPCARKEQCSFYKDKTVLCPQHVSRGNYENKLDSVAVFRRVYVNRDEHKQVASMIQGDQYVMRVGSLIFSNIGQLLPTQIQAFHTSNCIYPVGYKIIRMYWSMKRLGRRSQYVCTINENSGKPEFSIQVKEVDQKEVLLKDKTAKGVWQKVVYPIEKMRRQAKTIKIFPDFIHGDDLFGLTEPAVLRIIESLPGVDTLSDYNFRYGRSPFLELPLAINPTGCARSEPKLRTHFKRPHTLHTSHCSRSSFHSAFSGFEVSSPYIKQFVHSKSSQYRKMKTEWRNNVYLARSRIQGLGLYAARDLEKHTMVIEYIGQLIRNEIAERNEAVYDAQNRGVYMFRLDENRVIDATLSGGLARYMNHSCYPNCVAEVVQIDRENKILIITNRRITRGEELSYDYKFEVEDDQHKIPCLCGAGNCRKWMN